MVVGFKISVVGMFVIWVVLSGMVSFVVENLWLVKEENVVVFVGVVYGLLFWVLLVCVCIWFIGLCDRVIAIVIENFIFSNCSIYFLVDEFF